jgi:hypothetical protein
VNLQFIESPVYSNQIDDLLSAEEHRQLQLHLLEQPERGDIIKGAGGIEEASLGWIRKGQERRNPRHLLPLARGHRFSYFRLPEESTRGSYTSPSEAVAEPHRIIHQ